MGDSHVGAQARLMSQAMRKLSAVISRTNCVMIFINQLREKIGVMYGNPEVTTGGRALKFYATVRIDIRKANVIKEGADTIGNQIKCKVVKNKVAPPFQFAEFDIIYGKGINHMGEVIDIASALEIIDKAGAWYSYEGQRIGQGRDNARRFIEARPELAAEIEAKIRATSDEMKARISEHADAINLDESSETDELPDDDAELRD